MEELGQRVEEEWDRLDQEVIDNAISNNASDLQPTDVFSTLKIAQILLTKNGEDLS